MSLPVYCPQGCKLRVPARRAGSVIRCPRCRSIIRIPDSLGDETDSQSKPNDVPEAKLLKKADPDKQVRDPFADDFEATPSKSTESRSNRQKSKTKSTKLSSTPKSTKSTTRIGKQNSENAKRRDKKKEEISDAPVKNESEVLEIEFISSTAPADSSSGIESKSEEPILAEPAETKPSMPPPLPQHLLSPQVAPPSLSQSTRKRRTKNKRFRETDSPQSQDASKPNSQVDSDSSATPPGSEHGGPHFQPKPPRPGRWKQASPESNSQTESESSSATDQPSKPSPEIEAYLKPFERAATKKKQAPKINDSKTENSDSRFALWPIKLESSSRSANLEEPQIKNTDNDNSKSAPEPKKLRDSNVESVLGNLNNDDQKLVPPSTGNSNADDRPPSSTSQQVLKIPNDESLANKDEHQSKNGDSHHSSESQIVDSANRISMDRPSTSPQSDWKRIPTSGTAQDMIDRSEQKKSTHQATEESGDSKADESLHIDGFFSEEGTPDSHEDLPSVGIQPDLTKTVIVRSLAIVLILSGLFTIGPAVYEIVQWIQTGASQAVARWIFVLIFMGAIQFLYASYIAQLPDWSSTWLVSGVMLVFTCLDALVLASLFVGGTGSLVVRALQLAPSLRSQSMIWMLSMLCVHGLICYVCGREAVRWKRSYDLFVSVLQRHEANA